MHTNLNCHETFLKWSGANLNNITKYKVLANGRGGKWFHPYLLLIIPGNSS